MKRNITFLLTAVLLLMSSLTWGQIRTEVTDVLNRDSTGVTGNSYTSWSGVTGNSGAVYAGQSAGSNNSIQLRSNNSNSGIITTESGGTLTSVSVVWNSNTADNRTLNVYGKDSAYSDPTELYSSDNQGTLLGTIVKGTSTSLTIDGSYAYLGLRSASGAMYIEEIDIVWTTGGSTPTPTVATPTFTPAAGTYTEVQYVAIECATADATIYYTLDGTDPSVAVTGVNGTQFTEAISISETTTIKAIAVKEGMNNSAVATATYTIETGGPTPITIAEARALANNEYALVQGVVTFIDPQSNGTTNVYIQDATAGIDLYLNANSAPANLALGDLVQAYGKRSVYKGLVELSGIEGGDASQFSILSSGNTLPVAVKTIAEILADFQSGANTLQSTRVQIVEATVAGTVNTSGNTPITQGENLLNIYKIPAVDGLEIDDVITVTGIVGCYNNPQLRVALASDVTIHQSQMETVASPTFTPEAGTYAEAVAVTISTTPESATIYYTLDGNDPTPNSMVYAEAIIVEETTTIKAYATFEGMEDSEMATAVYTIMDVPVGGDFVRVTELSQLGNGAQVVIAARYNENASEYYAMTAQTSGKPAGVSFTSVSGTNGELLPTTITDEIGTYVWTVTTDGTNYTFTNASGAVLGYTSGTNFVTGGDNTDWTIDVETAASTAMAPNYAGFVVSNGNVTARAIALNANFNYGSYAKSNMSSASYNFFLDFFAVGGAVTTVCATPTFTPAAGTYTVAQNVTIACATAGAAIHYTLDGTEPTENSAIYTAPIAISETTTIKAIAMKEGMNNSAVATATYTIETGGPTPITIAEARALANNEYALVQGVVTFIDPQSNGTVNVYVQDATAGIDLYLNANTMPANLALGDLVQAYGKRSVYKGLVELSGIDGGDASQFSILSSGNTLPVAVKTIAELLADSQSGANMLQSTRVQIVEATVAGNVSTSGNTPITQGENLLNIYKIPAVDGLAEGDVITVTGVVSCYNNLQLRVALASDVTIHQPQMEIVATPTFSPAAGTYFESQTVTIACATAGATIHYTVDGTTPTANSAVYTAPITVSETTTIKAFATKADMTDSEIATAVYTITDAPVGGDFVRVTELSQLGNGAQVVIAARYNENASEYYAMTAQTSGKPTGVLFTSVSGTNGEILPTTITDEINTYVWTVTIDGANYTFTNADGNVLGYTSSTNFATGGDNINWTIEAATSEASAMVPEYSAYVVANANVTNRAFALNSNHNFGPYHTQNMASENYNFFVDIFATAGGNPTCATPSFDPEGGTYFETQTVTISCGTADATIYYTLDGSNPTPNSMVYTEPIEVMGSVTIKAYAVKEGFSDSSIAEAEYIIVLGAVTIFNQDWEGEMNGWTFVTVEGNKPWNISTYNGNKYAYANGFNGGVNEQWCISPAFNLEQYSDVTLTFMNAKNYTGPDLQLFFSNDYDGEDPAAATWTELEFEMSPGSYTWTESGVIEFTGFDGDNCYIGFKYTSTETEAAAWEIDDILLMGITSEPVLSVTPLSLSFNYTLGNGPSTEQSFMVSGFNLTDDVVITIDGEAFEMSDESGVEFNPMEEYEIMPYNGYVGEILYVRMAEGLATGNYTAIITVASELNDFTVNLNGTVTEPVQGGDWNRISSLADLHDGDQVVIAARFDATVGDGYYAMTAGVSGKPDGVLFTSVNQNGIEMLPDEIVSDIETFAWNVTVNDTVITLTNVDGDVLGYGSSTNFAGNTSTNWSISYATSGDNTMVPNYTGFLIANMETSNRHIVMNANHKFGAYHTNNINNPDYNFYLDLFVQGGSATQTVAAPVFSVASGTYYEELDVEITCATNGATIYYTTDGTEPNTESTVYTEPIHVDGDMTLKAYAVKDGYDDSNVTTANYIVITNVVILLDQNWEGEMDGWTFVTVEGNKPWSVGSYNGNHYAYANGYNDDSDNEQWCISPSFDLTLFAGRNVTLTFMNAMNYSGPDLELFFTNDYDGQDPEMATWVPLSFEMSTGGYAWTSSGPISLNAFTGSRCNIGFRYVSTVSKGAAAWEIDDIMLTADVIDEPYLLATPNVLTGFRHFIDMGPSETQTFLLSGGLLPTEPGTMVNLKVTDALNECFLISDNGVIFSNMLAIAPMNGALQPTTIYVRLNGYELGTFNSTVNITCGDLSTQVSLEGEVLVYDGIEESLAESVVFWNNNDKIVVENNSGNTLQMAVYNLLGQPVMSGTIDNGSVTITHKLATGMYVVTLQNNKERMAVKMIVR